MIRKGRDYKPPLESVKVPDGDVMEIPVMNGQLLICKGCCCGDTDRGYPEVPLDEYERQWRERGLGKQIHLTVSGCLGPCSVPNVVFILCAGRVITLHSINGAEDVSSIFDYIESMLDADCYLAPPLALADRQLHRFSFSPTL